MYLSFESIAPSSVDIILCGEECEIEVNNVRKSVTADFVRKKCEYSTIEFILDVIRCFVTVHFFFYQDNLSNDSFLG